MIARTCRWKKRILHAVLDIAWRIRFFPLNRTDGQLNRTDNQSSCTLISCTRTKTTNNAKRIKTMNYVYWKMFQVISIGTLYRRLVQFQVTLSTESIHSSYRVFFGRDNNSSTCLYEVQLLISSKAIRSALKSRPFLPLRWSFSLYR